MRVGILSLTWGYNFGGTLQTICLFRELSWLGYDPIVVDYRPVKGGFDSVFRGWGFRQSDRVARIRRKFASIRHLEKARRLYDQFKAQELCWSNTCDDAGAVDRIASEFDAIVVGSDQVWNLRYHEDPVFYLDGLPSFCGPRLAYAACCGNPAQKCPDWVAPALEKFKAVGVRNHFTADWVRRCSEGRVVPEVVCDPTILADDFPRRELALPDKFIASYHIGRLDDTAQKEMLRGIRSRYGDYPVVCMMATGIRIYMADWHDRILWHLDPFEWVEVIRRASVVFTDSFHAILFSLRFRVPFVATYSEEVRAPRLIELRDGFGLEGSVLREGSSSEELFPPDWDSVHHALEQQRKESSSFLSRALG